MRVSVLDVVLVAKLKLYSWKINLMKMTIIMIITVLINMLLM